MFERVSAKEYPMLHYTIEDGLPSNTIYNIYEDAYGMKWIGTDKGVSLFNGIKFQNYTTADGLSDNECFFFEPDYEGRLWIGTYNGQLCFYKNGKFHNPENTAWLKLNIRVSTTTSIFLNKDSSLTVFFKDNPTIVNIKNNKISYFVNQLSIEKYRKDIRFLFAKKIEREIYALIYSDEYLIVDFSSNRTLKQVKYAVPVKECLDGGDNIYCYTENDRLFPFDNPDQTGEKVNCKNFMLFQVNNTKDEKILATNRGLLFNSQKKILFHQSVNTSMLDRDKNLWIGTAKDGLYQGSDILFKSSKISDFKVGKIAQLNKINNNLVIATVDRNLYNYNLDNRTSNELFNYRSYSEKLGEMTGMQIIDSEDYYILSYTNNFKISNFLSPQKRKISKLKLGNLFGASAVANCGDFLYLRNRRVLFIASVKDFYDKNDSAKFQAIRIDSNNAIIYGFSKNERNQAWLSTIDKIFLVKDTNLLEQKQFKNASFRELIFCQENLLGITHKNQLLICSDYTTNKIQFDTIQSSNCIWDKFYKINDTTIIISTNNFYRILKYSRRNYRKAWSLSVIENPQIPFQPDYFYADSIDCYFSKKNEIISFPSSYVIRENPFPIIRFKEIKNNKKAILIKDTVALDYLSAQNIRINFTPISFYHQTPSYEYIISSDDTKNRKWNVVSSEELNLIDIGYGTFDIKVRAKTLSGVYSKSTSFTLIVQKPYWATWWFISIILLFLVLVISVFARLGIKRRLKKKEGEVRFLRSEYKALNALMNPHFIFNSLNSVQSLINNNENSTASKYVRIFSDLIRQNMRNISNELIPLSKELDLVENYLKIEKLRFKEKLNYSINIGDEVETEMILIPPLLIQPLVENAIKHGIWPKKTNDGLVQIRISEQDNLLKIEIEDNGNGFLISSKTDTLHESYAMGNIHQRIEQLSQIHDSKFTIKIDEIKDGEGKVCGAQSTVTIQLPKA